MENQVAKTEIAYQNLLYVALDFFDLLSLFKIKKMKNKLNAYGKAKCSKEEK